MIFGECPYCNEFISNAMPDKSPAFANPICEHCGKKYWIKCSRIESVAYQEEEFNKLYEVNHETKSIKERGDDE